MKRKTYFYGYRVAAFLTILFCFSNSLAAITISAGCAFLFRHLLVSTINPKHYGRLARP